MKVIDEIYLHKLISRGIDIERIPFIVSNGGLDDIKKYHMKVKICIQDLCSVDITLPYNVTFHFSDLNRVLYDSIYWSSPKNII